MRNGLRDLVDFAIEPCLVDGHTAWTAEGSQNESTTAIGGRQTHL